MRSQKAGSRMPFSRRNTVDDLHHECAVQRPSERSYCGEAVSRNAIGRVPRVPDEENVVSDLGNPVEAQVEVRPLRVVVVLHEAEKGGPCIEVVLHAAGGQQGREPASRQPGGRAGQVGTDNDVRSEEHTSELQSLAYLVCRLLLEKKKKTTIDLAVPNQDAEIHPKGERQVESQRH